MDVQCCERFYIDFGHALSFGSEAVELPKCNRHTREHQKHYECVRQCKPSTDAETFNVHPKYLLAGQAKSTHP